MENQRLGLGGGKDFDGENQRLGLLYEWTCVERELVPSKLGRGIQAEIKLEAWRQGEVGRGGGAWRWGRWPMVAIDESPVMSSLDEDVYGFVTGNLRRRARRALGIYRLMLERREPPGRYTYPILIESCTVVGWEFGGRLVQCHDWKVGFYLDVYVRNNLISMHAACGDMGNAGKVFDESPVRDLVSWNSLLVGYVAVGDVEEAMRVSVDEVVGFGLVVRRDSGRWV